MDNAATVAEALALMDRIQLVMTEKHGSRTTVHATVEDAGGDFAIIEHIGGKPLIHHGREYRVMTNDPPCDQQLDLAGRCDFSHPTSDTTLPGNVNPRDRFVRATYFLRIMPGPQTQREGVASMFAIARNVSVPYGAPYKGFGIYNTEYRSVMDDTNRRYFFELTTSPNIIWAECHLGGPGRVRPQAGCAGDDAASRWRGPQRRRDRPVPAGRGAVLRRRRPGRLLPLRIQAAALPARLGVLHTYQDRRATAFPNLCAAIGHRALSRQHFLNFLPLPHGHGSLRPTPR
ncbi:MAG: linear amide C-N hydrolase [Rhodopila sp.]